MINDVCNNNSKRMKRQADWIQKSIDSCRKAVAAMPKDIADAARRSGTADTLKDR